MRTCDFSMDYVCRIVVLWIFSDTTIRVILNDDVAIMFSLLFSK